MGDILHHIQERFPDKQDMIANRMAEDAEFCSICEDYGACIKAYRYWMRSRKSEAGARVKEYRNLIQALESEIKEVLLKPHPRP